MSTNDVQTQPQRRRRNRTSTVKGGDRGTCMFCKVGKPAAAGAALGGLLAAAIGGNVTNGLALGAAAGAGIGYIR